MAAQTESSPLVFDAEGQAYAGHVKVLGIHVRTGAASGEFVLKTVAAGKDVIHTRTDNPNSTEQVCGPLGWVPSLYVHQMPLGGEIYVYYE